MQLIDQNLYLVGWSNNFFYSFLIYSTFYVLWDTIRPKLISYFVFCCWKLNWVGAKNCQVGNRKCDYFSDLMNRIVIFLLHRSIFGCLKFLSLSWVLKLQMKSINIRLNHQRTKPHLHNILFKCKGNYRIRNIHTEVNCFELRYSGIRDRSVERSWYRTPEFVSVDNDLVKRTSILMLI